MGETPGDSPGGVPTPRWSLPGFVSAHHPLPAAFWLRCFGICSFSSPTSRKRCPCAKCFLGAGRRRRRYAPLSKEHVVQLRRQRLRAPRGPRILDHPGKGHSQPQGAQLKPAKMLQPAQLLPSAPSAFSFPAMGRDQACEAAEVRWLRTSF